MERYRWTTIFHEMESLPVSRSRSYHGAVVQSTSRHGMSGTTEPAGDRRETCEQQHIATNIFTNSRPFLRSSHRIDRSRQLHPAPADDARLAMALALMRCSKGPAARLKSTRVHDHIQTSRPQSPRYPRDTPRAHDIPPSPILHRVVARDATRTLIEISPYPFGAA